MTAADRSRRPPPPVDERERIIEATLLELRDHGPDDLCFDRLARRARVARGTLQAWFADRDELLGAVATLVLSPIIEQLHELDTASVPDDERLARYLLHAGEVLMLSPVPVARMLASPCLHTEAVSPLWAVVDDITAVMARWVVEVGGVDPDQATDRLHLAATSLIGWLLFQPDLALARLPSIVGVQLQLLGVDADRATVLVDRARLVPLDLAPTSTNGIDRP